MIPGKIDENFLDTVISHKIDCYICGETAEVESETAQQAADSLYTEGWRHSISKKLGAQGMSCPLCVKIESLKLI